MTEPAAVPVLRAEGVCAGYGGPPVIEDVSIATHVFHHQVANREEKLKKRMKAAFDLLMNGLHTTEKARKSLDHHVVRAADTHAPRRQDVS